MRGRLRDKVAANHSVSRICLVGSDCPAIVGITQKNTNREPNLPLEQTSSILHSKMQKTGAIS